MAGSRRGAASVAFPRGAWDREGYFSKNGDRAAAPDFPQPSRSRGHFLEASDKIFGGRFWLAARALEKP